MHPRLTTVHVFLEEVGKQLAEFVLRRIEQPSLAPQKSIIPTKLVKRESTAPTPAIQHDVKYRASDLESGLD
jgi:DNA-binding LacI/PurR family transcriptional regulator